MGGGSEAVPVPRAQRQLATRSMYVSPPQQQGEDVDDDLTDAEAMAVAHRYSNASHAAAHGAAGFGSRPLSGAGNVSGAVRSRYMDNIPPRLRQAYEAQSAMEAAATPALDRPLGRMSNDRPLGRISNESAMMRAHQAQTNAGDHAPAMQRIPSLAVSPAGSLGASLQENLAVPWQYLPASPGAQGRAGRPGSISVNWGIGMLPPVSTAGDGPGLARTSVLTEGLGGAGASASGAAGDGGGGGGGGGARVQELMQNAPPLLLKSFTHLARPSMQELMLTRSRTGINGSEAGGGGGGDAHLNMGYHGNALYVKSVHPDNQAQMLGDDEDPDRPLTRGDKLRLLAWGLINPEGRTKWDLCILVLLAWVCFASPLIICFDLQASLANADPIAIVEMTVDSFFIVDITLNFRTAYYDSMGNLVSDRVRIARHYMRSWFVYDLISVIPFDLITEGMLGFLSMLKLLRVIRVGKVLRMLRLYRLMRVTRLPRILERIEHWLDKGVLQIIMFAMAVGLLAHLSACMFHYMALITFFVTGSWDNTWIEKQGLVDADLHLLYVNSIYWAFTTVATVGYGDITPINQQEKIMAILVMASGVTLIGYVTSSITSLMSIRSAVSTKTAVKKQAVTDVLKHRQVPSALGRRVRAFFNYESTKLIRADEEAILQDLPFKLRSRFLQHAYVDTLCRLPCFIRLRPDILIDVIAQLKCAYFTDGDIVALQGDLVSDMYFVHEGKLELRVYDFPDGADPWAVLEAVNKDELAGYEYTIQGRMKRTYYFGHASAVHGSTWPGTVVARNCCELFGLSHDALAGLASRHPHALGPLLDVAEPPLTAKDDNPSMFTIDLLRVDIDPQAIAADFPMLDPPPRKRGLGNLLSGAVRGVTHVAQGLGALATMSNTMLHNRHVDTPPLPPGPASDGDPSVHGMSSTATPPSCIQTPHPPAPSATRPPLPPPPQRGRAQRAQSGLSRFAAAKPGDPGGVAGGSGGGSAQQSELSPLLQGAGAGGGSSGPSPSSPPPVRGLLVGGRVSGLSWRRRSLELSAGMLGLGSGQGRQGSGEGEEEDEQQVSDSQPLIPHNMPGSGRV